MNRLLLLTVCASFLLFAGCQMTPDDVIRLSTQVEALTNTVGGLGTEIKAVDEKTGKAVEVVAGKVGKVADDVEHQAEDIKKVREEQGKEPDDPLTGTEIGALGGTLLTSILGAYIAVNKRRDALRKARGERTGIS